ncbi:ParA family protein [Facilibium subflavum]|uniref:ParA family protein n=1 Tax=Facilibium subflavum TaxID=2219058 RepID=UPI000E64EBC1|nr:ParA family protein [Facilibium subflavum]
MNGYIFSQIKINEIARLTGTSAALVSRYFKNQEENRVTRVNQRIVGIQPSAAQDYLKNAGLDYFYMPSVTLFANLCGGVGKTSGVANLSASLRRIVNKETPIVLIDGDSQASLTGMIFGKEADDEDSILVDYLEGKAKLDDIVTPLHDNIWVMKSNLNQAWIEKVLVKPKEIKEGMLNLYKEIFSKFGSDTKIFQDHTPQLSNLFASSVCALFHLPNTIKKSILIPMRSDSVAINGANYIIKEIEDVCETFSRDYDSIGIHCYFSNVDRRFSTTSEALELIKKKPRVMRHLASPIIRTCADITKSTMSHQNIFSSGKSSNAIEDFQDLMQFTYQYGVER